MNWIVVSLLMLFLQAQPFPTQQQTRSQERASVSGFIVKMGTGEPVSKATVTISAFNGGRAQSYSATTTARGEFSFQNLEAGQYRLTATRSGYIRTEFGARSPNRPGLPITLGAGQNMGNVVLQILPAGTISGRVFDRDGEPVANVNVEALKYTYQEGQRVLNVVQNARTNDLGEYRLFWLQPGPYFVSATPPEGQRGALVNSQPVAGPGIGGAIDQGGNRGGGPRGEGPRGAAPQRGAPPPAAAPVAEEQPSEGYVPVYYPGTIDAQAAAPVNLTAGAVFSGVDLTVTTVRTLRVLGQVINGATGQPTQNANVMLIPVQGRGRGGRGVIRNIGNARTRIDAQGLFEIRGVVPGSYEVIAMVNNRDNRMTARLPIEVGAADVQNVALILSPGFTLGGRINVEGEPAAGQGAAGGQSNPRMRVTLRADAGFQGESSGSAVQADGTFTFQQVGRDDYRITVSGMPRNGYIKSARFGSTDVMIDGLRLDRQPTGALEIVVSTLSGKVDGVVQGEKLEPAPNVTVVFVPDGNRRGRLDLYRTVSTDAAGRFHLEGLPPGDYRVFSWENIENGAWQDPEFIRPFEDRGRTLRIDENGAANIELRLIPSQV